MNMENTTFSPIALKITELEKNGQSTDSIFISDEDCIIPTSLIQTQNDNEESFNINETYDINVDNCEISTFGLETFNISWIWSKMRDLFNCIYEISHLIYSEAESQFIRYLKEEK